MTGQLPITIWRESMINSIAENTWYQFTDMTTKMWKQLKVDSTRLTIIQSINNMPAVQKPDIVDEDMEVLSDPEVVCVYKQ